MPCACDAPAALLKLAFAEEEDVGEMAVEEEVVVDAEADFCCAAAAPPGSKCPCPVISSKESREV